MKEKRIVFLGGKDSGSGCLRFMLEEGYNVVGVILNPRELYDKGHWYASTVQIALEHDVRIFSFKTINSPEAIDTIRFLSPDLMTSIFFDEVYNSEVIKIPPLGIMNLHMAIAEQYRGRFPCNYTILNREDKTGVTLHYIDEGIDTGDIIGIAEIPIRPTDTARSLYERCTVSGIELFKKHLPGILDGTAPRRKQITTDKVRVYTRKDLPSKEVDFSKSGREIYDFIRAWTFPPFEPPCFHIGDKKMIIIPEDEIDIIYYKY